MDFLLYFLYSICEFNLLLFYSGITVFKLPCCNNNFLFRDWTEQNIRITFAAYDKHTEIFLLTQTPPQKNRIFFQTFTVKVWAAFISLLIAIVHTGWQEWHQWEPEKALAVRVKVLCAVLTTWTKCSQNTFTNGLSHWQSLRPWFEFHWSLPVQAGSFETPSFFPEWFFKHWSKPLNSKMISLTTAFISYLWLLRSGKIIWIPNVVSSELVVDVFFLRNSISTENSNETNSFISFLLIKLNLHTKRLYCGLIWLEWCRPIR